MPSVEQSGRADRNRARHTYAVRHEGPATFRPRACRALRVTTPGYDIFRSRGGMRATTSWLLVVRKRSRVPCRSRVVSWVLIGHEHRSFGSGRGFRDRRGRAAVSRCRSRCWSPSGARARTFPTAFVKDRRCRCDPARSLRTAARGRGAAGTAIALQPQWLEIVPSAAPRRPDRPFHASGSDKSHDEIVASGTPAVPPPSEAFGRGLLDPAFSSDTIVRLTVTERTR